MIEITRKLFEFQKKIIRIGNNNDKDSLIDIGIILRHSRDINK